MNRRLRQWGRYAPRDTLTRWHEDDLAEAEIREHMDAEGWQRVGAQPEPPPDTTWVRFEPINQTDRPRRGGRHRRQR